jgi:glucose-1-phosphate cytidylyltransferase
VAEKGKTMNNIPVVILAGGSGTRLREMTEFIPKCMIPIGGKPMLVHIINWYRKFGFNRFILALGYKQEIIKDYFAHYDIINNDITVDIGRYAGSRCNDLTHDTWTVTMVDTGEHTLKGGRLNRVEKYVDSDTFMLTYGDGVGNIDLNALLEFHQSHGKMVTVTGVIPHARFGEIVQNNGKVISFSEKPRRDGNLINAGFFVFNKEIFKYLTPDCDLEVGILEVIAESYDMMVYEHKDFWGCMDTLCDMQKLQQLWDDGEAKWKVTL